jgi:hypothetical protein
MDLEDSCFRQDFPQNCAIVEDVARNEEDVRNTNISIWRYTDSIMLLSSSSEYVGYCSSASYHNSVSTPVQSPLSCMVRAQIVGTRDWYSSAAGFLMQISASL